MSEYKISTVIGASTKEFKVMMKKAIRTLKNFERTSKGIDDPEFGADMKAFDAELSRAKRQIKDFNKSKASATIKADVKDAEVKIKRLSKEFNYLSSKRVVTNIDANVGKAETKLRNIQKTLEHFDKKQYQPILDINDKLLSTKLSITKKELQKLDGKTVNSNLDIDSKKAIADVQTFKAILKSVPNRIKTHVSADTDGAVKSIYRLKRSFESLIAIQETYQRRMDKLATSIRSFGTVIANQIKGSLIASFSALIPIIGGLVPAIMAVGNAIGVVGGMVIGLAGGIGILAGGMTAFGGMAVYALSLYNDGVIESSKQTKAFESVLDSIKSRFEELVTANAGGIFQSMANGINVANKALAGLTPFIEGIISSVQKNSQAMLQWINTSQIATQFFEVMGTTGVGVFDNMLSALGGFGGGFISLFTSFMPLIDWVVQGFANMGQAFMEWSQLVSTNTAIQDFTSYVQTNLPLIGQIFGNTFMGLFNLFTAFGANSQTIFEALAEMTENFRTWSEGIKQSDGFNQFVDYMQANGPVIMSLIGNIIMMLVNFGVAMAPIAEKVLGLVTAFAGWTAEMFRTNPVMAQILGLGISLIGMFMAILPTIVQLTTFIGPLATQFLTLSGRFGVVQATGLLLSRVITILKGVFSLLITPIQLVRTGLTLLAGVITGLSVPVLAIIAGILAFAAAIVYLWNTNESFRETVMTVWEFIKTTIMTVVDTVVSFVMEIWGMLVQFWNENHVLIQDTASTIWNAIVTVVTTTINAIWAVIQAIINLLMPYWQTSWEIIKAAVTIVWEAIKAVVKIAITAVLAIIKAVMQLINGDWRGAWNTIKEAGMKIWEIIKSAAINIFNALKTAVVNIWNILKGRAKEIWNAMKEVIVNIVNSIKSKINSVWDSIKSFISNVMDGIKNVITKIWNAIKGHIDNVMTLIKFIQDNGWEGIKTLISVAMGIIRDKISNIWSSIKDFISNITSNIRDAISNGWDNIKSYISDAMSRILDAVRNGFNRMVEAVKSGIRNAVDHAKSFVNHFYNVGTDLIMGLVNGVKKFAHNLIEAVTGTVGKAVDKAKSLLGIHSPSRVFREIGMYTMEGMSIGINKEGRNTISTVSNMADKVSRSFNPNLNAQMDSMTGSLGNINMQRQLTQAYTIKAEPNNSVVKIQLDLDDEAITAKVDGVHATRDITLIK